MFLLTNIAGEERQGNIYLLLLDGILCLGP
jgi:hypothetical protein